MFFLGSFSNGKKGLVCSILLRKLDNRSPWSCSVLTCFVWGPYNYIMHPFYPLNGCFMSLEAFAFALTILPWHGIPSTSKVRKCWYQVPRPRGHPKSTMRLGSPRCPTSNTANSTVHDFQGSLSILSTNNLEVWFASLANQCWEKCQRNGTIPVVSRCIVLRQKHPARAWGRVSLEKCQF